jgi:hypothetical protein
LEKKWKNIKQRDDIFLFKHFALSTISCPFLVISLNKTKRKKKDTKKSTLPKILYNREDLQLFFFPSMLKRSQEKEKK